MDTRGLGGPGRARKKILWHHIVCVWKGAVCTMFSATVRASRVEELRAELAQKQEEARQLDHRYRQVALCAEPVTAARSTVELIELAPTEPEDPRLRFHVARLRALIDRRRLSDIQVLLRGRPHLLDEFVRISPNQTALQYAMDRGLSDIVALLQASESAVGVEERI